MWPHLDLCNQLLVHFMVLTHLSLQCGPLQFFLYWLELTALLLSFVLVLASADINRNFSREQTIFGLFYALICTSNTTLQCTGISTPPWGRISSMPSNNTYYTPLLVQKSWTHCQDLLSSGQQYNHLWPQLHWMSHDNHHFLIDTTTLLPWLPKYLYIHDGWNGKQYSYSI